MAPPGSPPRGEFLVDESPRILLDPRVVTRRMFVWIRHGVPQIRKDLVRPRPCLTSWQLELEARPSPEAVRFLPRGGTTQAPHVHEVVGFMPRFPNIHVPENEEFGPLNVFCLGPQLPNLPHHFPRPPILEPCAPSQKEVPQNILHPRRRHHHRNILVLDPS